MIGVNLVTSDGTIRLICENNLLQGLANLSMNNGTGEWSDGLLTLNPLLRAELEKGSEPEFVYGEQPVFNPDYDPAADVAAYPLGFNVYRDDELIGFTSSRNFIDADATDGNHTYGVVCLYDGDNESAVSECSVSHYAGVRGATEESAIVRAEGRTVCVDSPEDAVISVFNLAGQIVATEAMKSGHAVVEIGAPGVYLVKVDGKKNSVIKKVVIY